MIKKRDLDEWARQEKAVQAEFLTLVNGGTGKKVKSLTVRETAQEDDEEEEEDEDEDYDDDDDEEEEGTSPSGCDLTLYEKMLGLREKRADVGDAVGELNKAGKGDRRAGECQTTNQRAIDKELPATEQDTHQFQSEKQSRFNQLDVVVPLTHRVAAENKELRQQFRDLHKQQNVIAKEKRQQQEAIARAQDRSEQLMRLKFGQLVDLEVLDCACDASSVDELQTRVKLREVEAPQ
ncbi:hypothetical protein PInf_017012 [Phytophthora infestans]|nr:hypothetical protein PInf_017012 [Phytophthora infestans]